MTRPEEKWGPLLAASNEVLVGRYVPDCLDLEEVKKCRVMIRDRFARGLLPDELVKKVVSDESNAYLTFLGARHYLIRQQSRSGGQSEVDREVLRQVIDQISGLKTSLEFYWRNGAVGVAEVRMLAAEGFELRTIPADDVRPEIYQFISKAGNKVGAYRNIDELIELAVSSGQPFSEKEKFVLNRVVDMRHFGEILESRAEIEEDFREGREEAEFLAGERCSPALIREKISRGDNRKMERRELKQIEWSVKQSILEMFPDLEKLSSSEGLDLLEIYDRWMGILDESFAQSGSQATKVLELLKNLERIRTSRGRLSRLEALLANSAFLYFYENLEIDGMDNPFQLFGELSSDQMRQLERVFSNQSGGESSGVSGERQYRFGVLGEVYGNFEPLVVTEKDERGKNLVMAAASLAGLVAIVGVATGVFEPLRNEGKLIFNHAEVMAAGFFQMAVGLARDDQFARTFNSSADQVVETVDQLSRATATENRFLSGSSEVAGGQKGMSERVVVVQSSDGKGGGWVGERVVPRGSLRSFEADGKLFTLNLNYVDRFGDPVYSNQHDIEKFEARTGQGEVISNDELREATPDVFTVYRQNAEPLIFHIAEKEKKWSNFDFSGFENGKLKTYDKSHLYFSDQREGVIEVRGLNRNQMVLLGYIKPEDGVVLRNSHVFPKGDGDYYWEGVGLAYRSVFDAGTVLYDQGDLDEPVGIYFGKGIWAEKFGEGTFRVQSDKPVIFGIRNSSGEPASVDLRNYLFDDKSRMVGMFKAADDRESIFTISYDGVLTYMHVPGGSEITGDEQIVETIYDYYNPNVPLGFKLNDGTMAFRRGNSNVFTTKGEPLRFFVINPNLAHGVTAREGFLEEIATESQED